ncbi:hypothetical protein CBR_g19683 [Chara braunii]|uniref:DNA-directed RNA polymerase III subunit RPC9 n=1 Tax=Chara braunii TaxID=69332 RepID=A0A388KYN7_CHABU|nr:hypothetical protein CBR_g19683 [Chara braunii]|eukprot:GBG75170.1 hypothetical protein CBR_g19683 [Chara braunii]
MRSVLADPDCLERNAGLLTNFEVLGLLRLRGADPGSDGAAIGTGATQSECQVFEYLAQSPAGTQNRQAVADFMREADVFGLSGLERLQTVNLRPSSAVEINLMGLWALAA